MSLVFKTTRGSRPLGYFEPSDPAVWRRHHKNLENAFRKLNSGEITNKECVKRCHAILEREPSFLGALALMNDCLMDENVTLDNGFLKMVATYLNPVRGLIPGNFTGALDEDKNENVYFLSCHLYQLLALVSLERFPEALNVCREHVRWQADPDPKAISGNIHILQRELDLAEDVFTGCPQPMPYESAYSLGLIKFMKKETTEAVEILRKAIILQPYVPELILNRSGCVNYSWNYPENEGLYAGALTYTNIYLGRKIWNQDPEALAFLDWLYSAPDMMAERAKALSLLNRLLFLKPSQEEEAGHLRNEFLRFASVPNPSLARKLLRKIPRDSTWINPWELCIYADPVNNLMERLFEDYQGGESAGSSLFEDLEDEGDLPEDAAGELFGDLLGGLSDCGDCADCDTFDECSNSPSQDELVCRECEECEIEGFCQNPANGSGENGGKKPPVRH
ncbi:MAG: hypothetical protein LBR53_09565 [Deltaproteobacteria bacterium]|jgi:tetratricopeptide (TPR) repeat protein|nr:hypothetical protein [Deltaproteobacteria bacterium]